MIKDINIQEFNNFNISYASGNTQRAINWLQISNDLTFTKFGVDWKKFISSELNISLLAIEQYAKSKLTKAGMNFEVVNIDLTDPSAPVFKLKEVN